MVSIHHMQTNSY